MKIQKRFFYDIILKKIKGIELHIEIIISNRHYKIHQVKSKGNATERIVIRMSSLTYKKRYIVFCFLVIYMKCHCIKEILTYYEIIIFIPTKKVKIINNVIKHQFIAFEKEISYNNIQNFFFNFIYK